MKKANEVIATNAANRTMDSLGYIRLNLSEFSDDELIELTMIILRKNCRKSKVLDEVFDEVDCEIVDLGTLGNDFLTVDEYLEEKYGF